MSKNMDIYVEKILSANNSDLRVICFGIGDGQKDVMLLERLLQKVTGRLEYWIVDISFEMMKAGLNNIKVRLGRNQFDRLDIKYFQMDFMNIDEFFRDVAGTKQNFYLLLGNTLGNFPENTLLSKIHGIMHKNDFLLIDNQLKTSTKKLTESQKLKLKEIYDAPKYDEYIKAVFQ